MQANFSLRICVLKVLILTSLLFVCSAKAESTMQELSDCNVDAKKILRGMCGSVASMHPDSEPQGRYRFIYQRKLLQASCSDPINDSDEQIAKKINAV